MRGTNRREFLKGLGLGAVALGATGGLPGPAEAAMDRPNVLWLSAEDISPLLGCYGDRFACTPNLDRLASEGVRYDRAYAHAPVCSPSRSGIITGLYPSTLGTHHHRSHATLPPKVRCFTEYLRQAGYYCSNNDKKDYNFEDFPQSWDESSKKAHWRNRKPGQPFFSVFNYTVSHESLLHKTEAEFEEVRKRWGVQRHDPAKVPLPAYHPDIPEFREDWARYYDAITALDAQIAERLCELEADGLVDSTVVMFWGDHGTGIVRGKRWLYESGTRIPLIIRFPAKVERLAPGPPGFVETRLVSFIDLAPTVLSLVGVPVPSYMQGDAFLGKEERPAREHVFFCRDRMDEIYDCIRAVRGKRFRYIRNFYPHVPYDQYDQYLFKERTAQEWHRLAGRLSGPAALFTRPEKPMEELFDTEADPEEVRDLARVPEHESTLLDMRRRLCEWMIETHDLGLLDEAEMYRRANGKAAMELGSNPETYDLPRILDTANLSLNGEAAIPELLSRLKDPDNAVRYWAATGLAALKSDSAQCVDSLRDALRDECPSVRVAVAHALCRVGRYEDAMPALVAELQNPDKFVRIRTLNVLALQQRKSAPAMESVKASQSDADSDVRRAAQSALVRMTE